MSVNVHHMNIQVNPKCAQGAIARIQLAQHNMCMTSTGHYLREWREHSNKTLVQVAEHLHMTHGTLSKIERGMVPYNQRLLEALAELYMCEPADLIMRNPQDPHSIWTVWERAKPADKRKIVSIAQTIVATPKGDAEGEEAA